MSQVIPAPALVIGIGRFGLATLEHLGDDWMGLRLSGADVSLENLRLAAVLPRGEAEGHPWSSQERNSARLAHYLGDGDLPSLALDFGILRALGLVRYRDGSYQVALPRDAGVVEVDDPQVIGPDGWRLLRRRYFEWARLSPDPLVAAEALHQLAQRSKDLDLFITPLLNRVRQGHSPRALLVCIGRCRALLQGRDPSPWQWLASQVEGAEGETAEGGLRLDLGPGQTGPRERARAIEKNLAGLPEPLPGWEGWLAGQEPDPAALQLTIPAPFVAHPSDLTAPLDPAELLDQDWESTGWASSVERSLVFRPLPMTPFRLGLFDHEGREGTWVESGELFRRRLRELGDHFHRGLIRLWVDLQRERVTEADAGLQDPVRWRDELGDSLQQALEVLGELVVRPLNETGEAVPPRRPALTEQALPVEPSRFLSGIRIEPPVTDSSPARLLARRLAELGLDQENAPEPEGSPLLEVVRLEPGRETPQHDLVAEPGALSQVADPLTGLAGLRQALNRQVRQLYDFSFLVRYRNRPTRRPPRLTVFVVADMSEPFTRAVVRPVLREIHAELLRAFTPIFESYREGFDRCLCVTPILWMPHPADPYQGQDLNLNRCEEAAIIDAVHGVRRWVESVLPPGRRCIPQIFVNSRVTDTAALSLRDAIRQTRDFLSFQIRNDLGRDHWLRQTASGAAGSDLFSSFSCYEIDFPALRCREYLANRLARECLTELKEGSDTRPEPVEPFAPPPVDDLVGAAREALDRVTGEAGEALAGRVSGRVPLDEGVSFLQIFRAFDERFETSLHRDVWACWRELTGRLGRVDELVDELRLRTSRLVSREVDRVRSHSDRLIEDLAGEGGLRAAQAGFQLLKSSTRDTFQEQERLRRDKEALCGRHAIPDLAPIAGARRAVLEAAGRKPERGPLRFGLFLWAVLSLALGAPLAHAVAYLSDLHLRPGGIELLLGPGGLLVGGLALFLPVWLLLRWHLRRRLAALVECVEAMAGTLRRLLWGTGARPEREGATSIRSFLESRLELTGAVATRGFSLRVLERALADAFLAHRLVRSADIQGQVLARRGEDLGVRAVRAEGAEGDNRRRREDLRNLFESRFGPSDRLLDPDQLLDYYRRQIGDTPKRELPAFLAAAG
ncbi:MAG TPA: hypothetical protein VHU81_04000, partial [Thermoanaerobaculia bacterium]|nr:hypothetical protein [Thermoanaerobaculia bacterium]